MKQSGYEVVLENLPFGVVFVNDDRILHANSAAENILGISQPKMQKTPFSSLAFSPKITDVFKRALAEGKLAKIYEEEFINYFGNKYLLNFYFVPVAGKPGQFIVVMEDRSFLKAMEEKSYEHAHIEKLSVLFASMAHEIKNPLGVIKGTAQLMKKDDKTGEQEAYDIIFSEIRRIEKLIQDLLDYSGPKKVNVEVFDVIELLNRVVTSLTPMLIDKNLVVIKEYDSTIPRITGDGETLYKAFFNVIKNAIEACYSGGKIEIMVKILVDMKYRENNKEYNYILIQTTDTGEGIKEEDIARLFTPFFTTKPQGTGLGMVYVQKAVLDHGGFLKVESPHREGARVSIFLPMKEPV